MAVEINVPVDPETMLVPAVYVNRFQATAVGPNIRIAFAEGVGGKHITFRTAVVLTQEDAAELGQLLLALAEQLAKITQTAAAQAKKPPPHGS